MTLPGSPWSKAHPIGSHRQRGNIIEKIHVGIARATQKYQDENKAEVALTLEQRKQQAKELRRTADELERPK